MTGRRSGQVAGLARGREMGRATGRAAGEATPEPGGLEVGDYTVWQAGLLGIVQGLTEFLPISSSGHLVIVEALLGAEADRTDVNIVLHAGTLLSILVFYWHQTWRLVSRDQRVIGLLVAGTLPAVVVGLTAKRYFEYWLEWPLLAGAMLPITGLMLLWVARSKSGDVEYTRLGRHSAGHLP